MARSVPDRRDAAVSTPSSTRRDATAMALDAVYFFVFFCPWRSVFDASVSRFSGVRGFRRSLPAWLSSFLLGVGIVLLQDSTVTTDGSSPDCN